jgi:enterobactin synthetase component D / holo-[acyl-carrier protein] synthase
MRAAILWVPRGRRSQEAQVIEQILPPCVAVAEAFERDAAETLPVERHPVKVNPGAVQREGLDTAREYDDALLEGFTEAVVPPMWAAHATRVWPEKMIGSFAHCAGYRAITVALKRNVAALGVDVQSNQPLPDDGMLDLVACGKERQHLTELADCMPGVCWDRLLFSAKLSVYKAWFPASAWWLNLDLADVVIDPFDETFTARLLEQGPIVGGIPLAEMRGRWLAHREFLATAVVI